MRFTITRALMQNKLSITNNFFIFLSQLSLLAFYMNANRAQYFIIKKYNKKIKERSAITCFYFLIEIVIIYITILSLYAN